MSGHPFGLLAGLLLALGSALPPASEAPATPESPLASEELLTLPPREYDHAHRFSIVPPAGWVDYVPTDDSFMAYRAPTKLTGASRFSPYFRITVANDLRLSVEDVGAHLKPFFNQIMGKWTLTSEGFELIDGRKSYFIGVRQDPLTCGCEDLQYYIPGQGTRYFLITFSAPVGDFARYEKLFRDVARSVELLD